MVDIGYCVPSFMVLSQLARWVSSRNSEPSVPGDLDRGGE